MKNKLVFLLLFSVTSIIAQPWNPQISATTNILYDIIFANDNVGYAVGVNGTIVKTSNGGATWNNQFSGVSVILTDVKFENPDTGYVAGKSGTILKTTNGGTNWNPLSTGTTMDFSKMLIIDSCIYASTYNGIIFKSTNRGLTWNQYPTGVTTNLYGMFFFDANNGYVAGLGGVIMKTSNGGLNWTPQTSGTPLSLHSIWFIDANTGYIAGDDHTADSCLILKTANGGATWTTYQTYTNNTIATLKFLNYFVGYAVGGCIATNTSTILKTVDAGATWLPQTVNSYRLESVSLPSFNVGYVCGLNGAILKTEGIASGINSTLPSGNPSFSISPNPFSAQTTITFASEQKNTSVTITDVLGKVVRTQSFSGRQLTIEKGDLNKGIYFVEIAGSNKSSSATKIIVE